MPVGDKTDLSSRTGSKATIYLTNRRSRTHAHEVAERLRRNGETYTLEAQGPDVMRGSDWIATYTGEAVTFVPTRLIEEAAKLLNRPHDMGSAHDLLRTIVGAARQNMED